MSNILILIPKYFIKALLWKNNLNYSQNKSLKYSTYSNTYILFVIKFLRIRCSINEAAVNPSSP